MENQDLNTISGLSRDLQSAERFIGNILKSEELSQKQREVLGKFDKHLKSTGKLTYTRKQYFVCLKSLGKFLKKDKIVYFYRLTQKGEDAVKYFGEKE
jgi:site-specific recombinase XerD